VVRFWTGGDMGFESKKLPPPPNMLDEDVDAGDFVLEKASRPEKGEGLGAGAGLKLRLPKASFMPPKADCVGDVCDWGDARPPNDSCRVCCCCGCAAGFGTEAYNDRIDCFRSGLDGAAEAPAGPVLEGLAGGAELPPRKSNPNNEPPAFVCFGGAASAFGGGALAATGGPVLDRGGAGAASPKRSITGAGLACGGGGGRMAAAFPARRCEAERSTWIFSWTLDSGWRVVSCCPSLHAVCTHHVVVVLAQLRWVGHRPIHDPALRLVLCADEVLNLGLGGHMAGRQLRFPVLVRPGVAPLQHALQLFVCPGVEVDRLDFADVRAHTAVDARAANAHEDTEVPAGPSRVCTVVSRCARLHAFDVAYACSSCSRSMSCCPRASRGS